MTDQTTTIQDSGGVDRREALRKAAIAAGVVAWTTPVVQIVAPGVAGAADNGFCTGCTTSARLLVNFTGSNCNCVGASPSCCNNHTLFVQVLDPTCGPASCGTPQVGTPVVTPGTLRDCKNRPANGFFYDIGSCSGRKQVTVSTKVTCRCSGEVTLGGTYCIVCTNTCAAISAGPCPAGTVEAQAPAEAPAEMAPSERVTTDAGGDDPAPADSGSGSGDRVPAEPEPAPAPEPEPAPDAGSGSEEPAAIDPPAAPEPTAPAGG